MSSIHPSSFIPNPLFSVRTPTATVTDLGTEFGVEVDKQGGTSAHVFHGVVEVQATAHGSHRCQAIQLNENESAQVQRDSSGPGMVTHRGVADAAAFVRPEQLPKLAEELRRRPFRRWEVYNQELRKDPSLLAFYNFQQKKDSPSILANVAGNDTKSLDGMIENAAWCSGCMIGKDTLRFTGRSDYVQINLPQKVDNLTLAAWVYVESLDNILNGLLMTEGNHREGQVHWQVRSDGCLQLSLPGWPGAWVSAPVLDSSRYRRWTHLAVVYDHRVACGRLYADGQLMGETKNEARVPICIGPAWIGHWNPGKYMEGDRSRNFHGRMGELAIFGRPLASDEIQHMYEVGRPRSIDDGVPGVTEREKR